MKGNLLKVNDANILKLSEEIGNLRELEKENEERVDYLQKQVESMKLGPMKLMNLKM